jgi:hypothetical protein
MRLRMAGVGDHHLGGEHAALPPARGMRVCADHALEHERELRADLRLLVRREDVDDAVDRLDGAELVCSVANARWPVSAIVSAASMVSRSRISPMRTTSGSWRRAYLSASLNAGVGADLALVDDAVLVRVQVLDRVLDRDDVEALSRLILSIIEASVVDLPEPVGPGDEDEPAGRSGELRPRRPGRPSSSKLGS